jgi:hypothetical protein
MAQSTPRADALRQMREAKFEAEQKRLKQEAGKPADAPKHKAEPVVGSEKSVRVDNAVTTAADAPAKAAKKAPKKAAKKAKAAAE